MIPCTPGTYLLVLSGVWSWGGPENQTLRTSSGVCAGFCLFAPSQPAAGSKLQMDALGMWDSGDGSALAPFIIEFGIIIIFS